MRSLGEEVANTRTGEVPRVNFILQPEFPMNALILASDALRIANQNSGSAIFSWTFASESGAPVRASNGMWFAPDCTLDAAPPAAVALVFEGNLPTQRTTPKLLRYLRSAARAGVLVGGVDTGAFALAQAGLVADGVPHGDHGAVLHWEAEQTFRESFPDALTLPQIFHLDSRRAYAAGGIATLDLVLALIARHSGEALANEVANALVHTRRPPGTPQRNDAGPDRAKPGLSRRLVALMEANLDFPLVLPKLAEALQVAPRTLSAACHRTFGVSPMRLYLRIRLQAARNMIFYEEFSVKDISIACGFSYPSVFSRAFSRQFGQTPRQFRQALRRTQSQAMRPEIMRLIGRSGRNIG